MAGQPEQVIVTTPAGEQKPTPAGTPSVPAHTPHTTHTPHPPVFNHWVFTQPPKDTLGVALPIAPPVTAQPPSPSSVTSSSSALVPVSQPQPQPQPQRKVQAASAEEDDEDDEATGDAGTDEESEYSSAAGSGENENELAVVPSSDSSGGRYVDITNFLNMPQSQAARKLGIPTSTLSKRWKEAVRNRKWPFRSISKLDKEIMTLLHNIPQSSGDEVTPLPPEIEATLGHLLRRRQDELKPVVIRI